ncbi:hypothetical protein DdX_20218 [Ditylenchus destructor]|uniref:Uncharacterized protein n=1 Tax=Ditylenchus destructor TaxID=166010 RepID=A0AAD4QTR9_9BILA|nr:hypothetical protein DdX_20218 [Ditylenchus destructor]
MNQPHGPHPPITLLVSPLGGEGGGVLTEWLVDTARHAGYAAQSTSIPGWRSAPAPPPTTSKSFPCRSRSSAAGAPCSA